jgi:hypothetical protein
MEEDLHEFGYHAVAGWGLVGANQVCAVAMSRGVKDRTSVAHEAN